jgi:hypothetical protein
MMLPAATFAQTQANNEESCRASAFPAMTYDENNRYLSDADCRTELFDRLKFIPLRGGDENYYLSFGVVSRDRGEYFSESTWGSGPEGNAYLMQRPCEDSLRSIILQSIPPPVSVYSGEEGRRFSGSLWTLSDRESHFCFKLSLRTAEYAQSGTTTRFVHLSAGAKD